MAENMDNIARPESACLHYDTVDEMARAAQVSRRFMFLALKVWRLGCPEFHPLIKVGSLTVNLAAQLVDMFPSHDDQRVMLDEFKTLAPRKWLGFARQVREIMDASRRVQPCTPLVTVTTTRGNTSQKRDRLPSHQDGICHSGSRP